MATEQQHRDNAANHAANIIRSRDESDTDGFLTQWASGLTRDLENTKADIKANGDKAKFTGLFEGGRRVKAKIINTQFGSSWLLHDDEVDLIQRRGKKFLPTGTNSRILRGLGLAQDHEIAPAWATMGGHGHGLSGTAFVVTFRTGNKWGQDASRIQGE